MKQILTKSDCDIIKQILDVSIGSVLLETVGGSEDVSVRDERSSTPPRGPTLCRPEAQIGRPGELIHLSELSTNDGSL